MRAARCALVLVAVGLSACYQPAGATYTLYRNSVVDESMRIHVATFDTADGEEYNQENCRIAADLFVKYQGLKTRFWCEKGPYRS
jgi:hypothetical protein